MDNKKITDSHFIERYMYSGKISKNSYINALLTGLSGLAMLAYGIYIFHQLSTLEETGGQIRINRFASLIYEIGGKFSVLAVLGILGISFICKAFLSYRAKTRD